MTVSDGFIWLVGDGEGVTGLWLMTSSTSDLSTSGPQADKIVIAKKVISNNQSWMR
jgi:hypothetical protein